MRIAVGTDAPDFQVSSQLAPSVRLSDRRGKKHVALVFLRHLGCPLCQLDLMDLARGHERLMEKDVEPIVFVESPPPSVARFTDRTPLPYHLVGDPERRVYSLYALEEGGIGQILAPAALSKTLRATWKGHLHGRFEGSEKRLPGGFVVDPAGRVILAHYGRDISDSLGADRILSILGPTAPR